MIKRSEDRYVPFADFDAKVQTLIADGRLNITDVMLNAGYAASTYHGWKKTGQAPLAALNSAKWLIHENGHDKRPAAPELSEEAVIRLIKLANRAGDREAVQELIEFLGVAQ